MTESPISTRPDRSQRGGSSQILKRMRREILEEVATIAAQSANFAEFKARLNAKYPPDA